MEKYLIDTPPPTISGKGNKSGLHIGHIFSYTQGDIIAKFQKYMGKDLIYPFCIDNNGIPTGLLASSNNISGRANIINFSLEKAKDYKDTFNSAGISFEENQFYHTFSDKAIEICYLAFEILKEKKIAYKMETEFLYSEKLKCSISQSE